MRAADAVITKTHQLSGARRTLMSTVTFAAWTAVAWLLLPLFILILSTLGLSAAHESWIGRSDSIDLPLIGVILTASAVASAALLIWAEVQRRRFTGVERRRRAPDATLEELSAALGADTATAATLRSARSVWLTMRDDGSPASASAVRVPRPRRPVDDRRTPAEAVPAPLSG